MAKSSATPLNLTPAQQDAHDALVTMKVPKEEAARLIAQAQGSNSGEILSHAPNLLPMYPLKSRVNVVDSKGNIVLPNARVADTSWIKEGEPTTNTFEIWNGPSLGKGYHLVPAG